MRGNRMTGFKVVSQGLMHAGAYYDKLEGFKLRNELLYKLTLKAKSPELLDALHGSLKHRERLSSSQLKLDGVVVKHFEVDQSSLLITVYYIEDDTTEWVRKASFYELGEEYGTAVLDVFNPDVSEYVKRLEKTTDYIFKVRGKEYRVLDYQVRSNEVWRGWDLELEGLQCLAMRLGGVNDGVDLSVHF